ESKKRDSFPPSLGEIILGQVTRAVHAENTKNLGFRYASSAGAQTAHRPYGRYHRRGADPRSARRVLGGVCPSAHDGRRLRKAARTVSEVAHGFAIRAVLVALGCPARTHISGHAKMVRGLRGGGRHARVRLRCRAASARV